MIPNNIAMLPHQIAEITAQLSRAIRAADDHWFVDRGIDVFNKELFWLLNQKEQDTQNHWNKLCNGMVFLKDLRLVSLPPVKLYSFKEGQIDLPNCDLVQKVDGEMFVAFFPWENFDHPCVNTRTKISYVIGDMDNKTPAYDGRVAVNSIKFKRSDSRFSYTFQFDGRELFLIAGRDLENLSEHSEAELDELADRFKCQRPMTFKCSGGWKTIAELLKVYDEAFLVRDCTTGDRAHVSLPINIKRPKLVESGKYKHLLSYWMAGEGHALLKIYPQFRQKFIEVDKKMLEIKVRMRYRAEYWLARFPELDGDALKAAVAAAITDSDEPYWGRRIILKLVTINSERWGDTVDDYFRRLTPKGIIDIMGLED